MKSISHRLSTNCNVALIEQHLHRALKNNAFYLVMQPIVRLDVGAECLEGECLVYLQYSLCVNNLPPVVTTTPLSSVKSDRPRRPG